MNDNVHQFLGKTIDAAPSFSQMDLFNEYMVLSHACHKAAFQRTLVLGVAVFCSCAHLLNRLSLVAGANSTLDNPSSTSLYTIHSTEQQAQKCRKSAM